MMSALLNPHKRWAVMEHAIKVIDLIVYGLVAAGGAYALGATPVSVIDSLEGYEWLATLWAVLLVVGGAVGFLGRLTGRWLVENPATIASLTGIVIYVAILAPYTFTSITAAVATALVAVAAAFMVRRWVELQMFGSEPDVTKMKAALQRRTGKTIATN